MRRFWNPFALHKAGGTRVGMDLHLVLPVRANLFSVRCVVEPSFVGNPPRLGGLLVCAGLPRHTSDMPRSVLRHGECARPQPWRGRFEWNSMPDARSVLVFLVGAVHIFGVAFFFLLRFLFEGSRASLTLATSSS